MKQAFLNRSNSTDQGTFSVFVCPEADFTCRFIELPWRDNINQLSCIPTGDYIVKPYNSPKFGLVFCINNVPNRTSILVHSGNFAGNIEKGWKTNSLGCLLPGERIGTINGQNAVLGSKIAANKFIQYMGMEDFKLKIL